MEGLRARFLVELVLGALSVGLGVLTLAWRDWIEVVFGTDPDGHSGALEWLITAGCALLAIGFLVLAGHEFRRSRPAHT